MKLSIKNPNHEGPGKTFGKGNANAINAWLKTQSAKEYVTFDDLRAQFPAVAGFTDGEVADLCAGAGLVIADNPE